MALLWIDGFDHYTTTSGAEFDEVHYGSYQFVSNINNSAEVSTMPELGGYGFSARMGPSGPRLGKGLDATFFESGKTVGVGAHFYLSALDLGLLGLGVFGGSNYHTLYVTATGQLQIRSTPTGTVLADSGGFLISNLVLYHIEVQFYCHDSTGSITVRVNGLEALSATSIDTVNTGVNQVNFLIGGGGPNYMDNLYIYDGTGSYNNDWLGERNVYTLMPSGDGSVEEWALSTGSDSYALVDEIPPNTSDYIESDTVDQETILEIGNLPTTNINVIGVQTMALAEKTGTDITEISAAVVGATPVSHVMTQSQPTYVAQISETDPDTGLPWENASVDALEVSFIRQL